MSEKLWISGEKLWIKQPTWGKLAFLFDFSFPGHPHIWGMFWLTPHIPFNAEGHENGYLVWATIHKPPVDNTSRYYPHW